MINLSRINPYTKQIAFEQRRNGNDQLLTINGEALLCVSTCGINSTSLSEERYAGNASNGGKTYAVKDASVLFFSYEWQRLVSALGIFAGEEELIFNAYNDAVSIQTRMVPVVGTGGTTGMLIFRIEYS